MPPRYWIVSELYYPEETSTGYFVTRIAEEMARFFPIGVLCSQPTYSSRGTRAAKTERHNGVDIQRCSGTTLNKNFLPFRIVNFVSISLSLFAGSLLRIRRGDVILVVTNPPLLPMLAALVCWLRRARYLLLIHDLYPEILVVCGVIAPDSWIARMVDKVNRIVFRGAERIIVLGRDMERRILGKIAGVDKRIVVIPNWGETGTIYPTDRTRNPLLHRLGIETKFVIQYSGNMGRSHGIEDLVEAADRLRDDPSSHFLFIGWGAKRRWLERECHGRELRNVTLLPNQRRDDLTESLNACDIAAISFISGMSGISVPSRMYNVLAAGKPLLAITDADSELAMVVREEDIGWVVPPGEITQVLEAIREARSDPDRLREMGARARRAAENKYTLGHAIMPYRLLFQEMGATPE